MCYKNFAQFHTTLAGLREWHLTPASSTWVQSAVLLSYEQVDNEVSVPVHATSSKLIGPMPWPYVPPLKATSPGLTTDHHI